MKGRPADCIDAHRLGAIREERTRLRRSGRPRDGRRRVFSSVSTLAAVNASGTFSGLDAHLQRMRALTVPLQIRTAARMQRSTGKSGLRLNGHMLHPVMHARRLQQPDDTATVHRGSLCGAATCVSGHRSRRLTCPPRRQRLVARLIHLPDARKRKALNARLPLFSASACRSICAGSSFLQQLRAPSRQAS